MKPPRPVLPARYYLDHFEEMLAFVEARYPHTFGEEHFRFLDGFRDRSAEARCLYVRLANRRGRVFRIESLSYPEIPDREKAISELIASGFARLPRTEDYSDLLAVQPRTRLAALAREQFALEPGGGPRPGNAKKAQLVRRLLSQSRFETCFPPEESAHYLVQDQTEALEFLLFLYFGRLERSLTSFALRDLGIARTAEFREDFEARFETGSAARSAFHYARVLETLDTAGGAEARSLCSGLGAWPDCEDPGVAAMRHRALHRLGRLLEREGNTDEALRVYALSGQFPSTERIARLLVQEGRREEAEELLLRLIDDPSCDEELLFAEDFLERKFQRRRTGRFTAMLREAPVLFLDESWRDRPEAGAVAHFRRRGEEAHHTENAVWVQLFALLFWDRLFSPDSAALHNPFEFRPRDLDTGLFFKREEEVIRARLRLLDEREEALALLRENGDRARSTPNGLFAWDEPFFDLALRLVSTAPQGALAKVLEPMARGGKTNRSGFPDLLVFGEAGPRFVEIKTEGDQVQRHQLVQIDRIRQAGFGAAVARIGWTIDPDQEYVVVDLETTGGDPARHRVTEIGAVRVRAGKVIAEWSTLVNPGRRIPAPIVALTGITDAMVAEAPSFAGIAAECHEFLAGAVFVAHRAKFDLGFLRAEFARLDLPLHCPVLCTLVESRRHFPGLDSYGLASLCSHFGIPLDSHHRALCDARATADLLLRIQEKRLSKMPGGQADPAHPGTGKPEREVEQERIF